MLFLICVLIPLVYLVPSTPEVQAQTPFSCRKVVFSCDCGNPGYVFQANFNQCHYWLPREQACTKFQYCLECDNGLDICLTCPPNRYGRLCRGVCQCKEGQICNRDTGRCEGKATQVTVSCSPPHVESAVELKEERVGGILKAIEFSCPDPFSLSGATRITCNDGKWDKSPPRCVAVPCIAPKIQPPLEQKLESEGGVLMAIDYTCPPYTTLVGASRIICNDGKWDNNPPRCRASGCPRPNDIRNGRIEYFLLPSGTRIGGQGSREGQVFPTATTAVYKCDVYYKPVRKEIRQCLSTGEWDAEPRCVVDCGISEFSKEPNIINGTITKPGFWPWQAALANLTNHIFCGGSLITEKWVLTAAHCLYENGRKRHPNQINVFLGKYFRYKDDENVQQTVVRNFTIHQLFSRITLDNDIALLELSEQIRITPYTLPVCLTKRYISHLNVEVGKSGVVTGWGITETGQASDVLKRTTLTIISNTECAERNSRQNNIEFIVTENMFCAGVPDGITDVCKGDSGGPMVFEDKRGQPRWIQEGIVSWGASEKCASDGLYSGFTKVVNFLYWIYSYVPDLP